jgi:phospholipid-transporting ATPase
LLKRLLFYYGREAYRKNSALVLYNFYKNMIYILPQFWNGFYNGLSGNNLYESVLFQCFNIVFAAFPIVIFSTLDEDSLGDVHQHNHAKQSGDLEVANQPYDCSEYLCRHPKIYTPGHRDNYFNQKIFWFWFGNGVFQAYFMQLVSYFGLILFMN